MQARYVHYNNLRSRDKSFNIGDAVLILVKDSSNKTFSQWQGPAKVIEKKAPYSYIVELNNTRRQLHASMLRPYYTRINEITCAAAHIILPDELYQSSKCVNDVKNPFRNPEKRMNVENECIIENTLHIYGCAIVSDDGKDFDQLQTVETNTNQREHPASR